ncbi:MAG TPA: hypothetical protein PLA94_23535 [Myxococcota bacterium]|nr:hypothetical protein [Myxococcota bacterium]HND32998.1 hypothetical protein [Myxococcota bacterium]
MGFFRDDSIPEIIHAASIVAAGVGAGLAQLPGSDAPVLMGIQSTMILAIADAMGVRITRAAAVDLLLTFGATMAGRWITQVLVGWLPGWGNAINGATAAILTQFIGWTATRHFGRR